MRLFTSFFLVMALVLALPGWGSPLRKPYEERTPEEIRAEVDRLEQKQMGIAMGMIDKPFSSPEKQQPSASAYPQIRYGHIQRPQAAQKPLNLKPRPTITINDVLKGETARKLAEKKQSEQNSKVNQPTKPSGYKTTIGADGLREYEIDLPIAITSNKKGHSKKYREKARVRANPNAMALHNQIQGLNQMLINDVVRLTGKSAQRTKPRPVRR